MSASSLKPCFRNQEETSSLDHFCTSCSVHSPSIKYCDITQKEIGYRDGKQEKTAIKGLINASTAFENTAKDGLY